MGILRSAPGLFALLAAFSLGSGLGLCQEPAAPPAPATAPASNAEAAKIVSFNKELQFSYLSWEKKVKIEGGKAIFKELKTDGGGGVSESMDLSSKAACSPALKLKTGPANTAKSLRIQLLDAAGVAARWEFQLPKPSGDFAIVLPKDCAALSTPNEAEDKSNPDDSPSFDLSKTTQWQLLGDWQPGVLDVEVEGIWAVPPDAKALAVREAAAKKFILFDSPFRFAFGDWEKAIKVEGGKALFKNTTAKGGTGANEVMNLLDKEDSIPALKLRTGPENTTKVIFLNLWDSNEVSAVWEFRLPPSSESFSFVTANNASLAKPTREQDKVKGSGVPPGSFNIAQVKGWLLQGNWQPSVLDVEIEEFLLLPPDPAAERKPKDKAARAKQRAEAKERKIAQEREDQKKLYSKRGPSSPEVKHTCLIAPDLISLAIEAQKVVLPKFGKYVEQPGDEKKLEKWPDGVVRRARLIRDGKDIGWLQGKNLDYFSTYEGIEGDPLLYFLAENPANYEVTSPDDPAYATPQRPAAVYRKSIPIDWQLEKNEYPMRHTLFLKMAQKLSPGKTYKISIAELNVKNPEVEFAYDSRKLRSDAVHVNQIGYRPDDPAKRAFLSAWLGTGKAFTYPEGLRFSVIDEASGKDVFNGAVELALAADGKTECLWDKTPKNHTGTAVYRMDFGDLKTPGRYRVSVEGVGCSYPFEIGPSAWEKAFLVQMRGLFHNRSGIELGEPYTTFKKPRDFHPADGAVVTRTTYDAMLNGNEAFGDIVKGDTGEAVPGAWGGYHDAGDWNPRRVSHMAVTMAQLELVEMYPAYFNSLKLNIPPTTPGVPDVITEALFELDCFRRIQLPDGGIPYGIETNGDPSGAEASWLSTHHAYVLAPNIRDSWQYAAVAARAAKVLKPIKPELADVYQESAKKAFAWAEADYAKRKANGTLEAISKELWRAIDNRNLSALELYDLTGDKSYHDVFFQNTRLKEEKPDICWFEKWIQCDAAFLYARLDDSKADPALKKKAIEAVVGQAERSLEYAKNNPFNLTQMDKWRPRFGGFYSVSGGTELSRAHYLTGKPEYLAGALRSCQFQSGCNPNNIVYTTGLGSNPVKHPLHLDSRSTGQPPPEGLTTFGNVDYWNWKSEFWAWPIPFISKPNGCFPHPYDWPIEEAYFDIFLFVSMDEFTVDTWTSNVFVWGYLAARPKTQAP